jgi:hypothetical protein
MQWKQEQRSELSRVGVKTDICIMKRTKFSESFVLWSTFRNVDVFGPIDNIGCF